MKNKPKGIAGLKTGRVLAISPGSAKVEVMVLKIHPLYRKRYYQRKHFLVANRQNQLKIGDKVEITPCRPLSRRKRYFISRKIEP